MSRKLLGLSLIAFALVCLKAEPLYAMGSNLGRRQIIEGDQAKMFPFNSIGKLRSYSDEESEWSHVGTSECTAVRVGRRVLLSAAHCFHWVKNGQDGGQVHQGDPTGAKFDYEDPETGEYQHVDSWVTGTDYTEGTDSLIALNHGLDWAVVTLSDDAPESSHYLDLAPASLTLAANTPVAAAGFSTDIYQGDVLTFDPSCQVISATASVVQTTCEIWKGASGGPDLAQDAKGNPWIVGIHTLIRETKPPIEVSTAAEAFREPLRQARARLGE